MRYGSVCSGIEAATVAWHPLGWQPVFFSEIAAFPQSVLRHHYGCNIIAGSPRVRSAPRLHNGVWNFGDFTTIRPRTLRRLGLDAIDLLVGGTPCQSFSIAGLRGGLDDARGNLALEYLKLAKRLRPRWLVWENVPGVLSSSGGRDFGAILGGMVELGYGFAYRVLDAQYVRVDSHPRAVPQRRRRVFVVGYLGDWRRAAAVLFEREGLSGHPAPRRQPGQGAAPTLSARTQGGGGLGTDFDLDGGLVANPLRAEAQHSHRADSDNLVAPYPQRQGGAGRMDYESETLIAHTMRGGVFDDAEPFAFDTTQITSPECRANPQLGGPRHPISAQAHPPAIAFDCKASGRNGFGVGEVSPTLRAMGHKNTHQNAGGQVAVAFNARQDPDVSGAVTHPIDTDGQSVGVLADTRPRRLMPVECERLQGFPDHYTDVLHRGKSANDGPRYKSLGNSMAIPPMSWIGQRIDLVDRIPSTSEAA